jgi:glycosyltransferase involved in cell wall biosynthesis
VNVAVLMPAFNEAGRVVEVIRDLCSFACLSEGAVTLFLVDDGSARPVDIEAVRSAADAEQRRVRIVFARHPVNLGQGAALETARRLALSPAWVPASGAFDAYVTMDSDGQHAASDVFALATAIHNGADVALGNRFAGGSHIPRGRRWLLFFARLFEWATTGLRLSDVHNGLRAFGPRAITAMRMRQNRMAHATELTRRIANESALVVVEVPVSVRYTAESLAKGQRTSGAIAIVFDLFNGFLFGSESR